MKVNLNLHGVDMQVEGTPDEVQQLINSQKTAKAATPEPQAVRKVKHTRKGFRARPWKDSEVAEVVSFITSMPKDTKGLPEIAVKQLKGTLNRPDSGIYNMTWRVNQYLTGDKAATGHLSKRVKNYLDTNVMHKYSRNNEGFLGRVNNQGVGRRLEVQEA